MTATPTSYVTVVWDAKAKAGREADLKAFITAAVTPSRNDPGNIDYEAHEVEGRPGEFVIYERWETRAHLDAHLHRHVHVAGPAQASRSERRPRGPGGHVHDVRDAPRLPA